MAKKKTTTAVTKTKTKAGKGSTKKALKAGIIARVEKKLSTQKVDSKGLSAHKKARFNVTVVMRQVEEAVGFLAKLTDFDITIKGRPVHGKGRKDHFNVIDRKDLIAIEGAEGSACRVLFQKAKTVATYSNATYERKANGYIILNTECGETVTLVPSDLADIQIAAVID